MLQGAPRSGLPPAPAQTVQQNGQAVQGWGEVAPRGRLVCVRDCCGCCCVILRGITQFGIAQSVSSVTLSGPTGMSVLGGPERGGANGCLVVARAQRDGMGAVGSQRASRFRRRSACGAAVSRDPVRGTELCLSMLFLPEVLLQRDSSRRLCGNVDNCAAVIQVLVEKPQAFPSDCGKPVGSIAVHRVFHMSGKHVISTRLLPVLPPDRTASRMPSMLRPGSPAWPTLPSISSASPGSPTHTARGGSSRRSPAKLTAKDPPDEPALLEPPGGCKLSRGGPPARLPAPGGVCTPPA